MPDLGPYKRAVRLRPVMVVTRGYDPTQPNKTSFLAPPKSYVSTDTANFAYSGMCVRRLPDGTTVPTVANDMTTANAATNATAGRPNITSSQVGWAFQDANRFDIVGARMANNFSARSDGEIRTGYFDRSVSYKIDDALTLGALGELTLWDAAGNGAAGCQIVGRVSALPKFEGGNPRIGNVNYTYLSTLPIAPVAVGAATIPSDAIVASMVAFTTALNLWVTNNGVVSPGTFLQDTILNADTGPTGASKYLTFNGTGALAYPAAVLYATVQNNLRKAASDISSLQATDNSMLTFVTARL